MLSRIYKGLTKRCKTFYLYHKYKAVLDENKKLAGIGIGKRCFIIGNGPSIEKQDLLKLAGEETFIVNTFYYHPQFSAIKPKNYLAIDAGDPRQKTFFFKDELVEMANKLVSHNIRCFFSLTGFYQTFKELDVYQNKNIHYLMVDGFFRDDLNFNIKVDKPIPQPKNIILACIMTAAYMGFETIYLLGCDHDFLAHPKQFAEGHAYGTYFVDPKNDEERKYYGMYIRSYEEQIDQVKILFRNYRLLKAKIAQFYPLVKILNATPNSFLDVFPSIKFEDIDFRNTNDA